MPSPSRSPALSSAARTQTTFGPGKVILLGEHGVVYGHPALAAPLSWGVTAHGVPSVKTRLVLPPGLSSEAKGLLRAAFDRAVSLTHAPAIKVTLQSELPLSMGLGSSGALAVACTRLLLQASGKKADLDEVQRIAFEMEKEFHGTPSGVDHTTSAQGSLIHYRRQVGSKTAFVTPVSSPVPIHLVVAIAGARAGTKGTVAALRARKERFGARYVRLFKEIGLLVNEARTAIEAGDLAGLGDSMGINQGLLSALGLSSPSLDAMVHRLGSLGALGAKLTGAGGDGGAVIGLFEDPSRAVAALKRDKIFCFASQIAGPRS